MRRGRDHCETIENWRQDSVVPLVKLELKHPLGEGDGRTVQGQALVSLLVDETGQPSTESERTGQLVASQCAVSRWFSEMASAVERLTRQPPRLDRGRKVSSVGRGCNAAKCCGATGGGGSTKVRDAQ